MQKVVVNDEVTPPSAGRLKVHRSRYADTTNFGTRYNSKQNSGQLNRSKEVNREEMKVRQILSEPADSNKNTPCLLRLHKFKTDGKTYILSVSKLFLEFSFLKI